MLYTISMQRQRKLESRTLAHAKSIHMMHWGDLLRGVKISFLLEQQTALSELDHQVGRIIFVTAESHKTEWLRMSHADCTCGMCNPEVLPNSLWIEQYIWILVRCRSIKIHLMDWISFDFKKSIHTFYRWICALQMPFKLSFRNISNMSFLFFSENQTSWARYDTIRIFIGHHDWDSVHYLIIRHRDRIQMYLLNSAIPQNCTITRSYYSSACRNIRWTIFGAAV